jgi:hypothetical protein
MDPAALDGMPASVGQVGIPQPVVCRGEKRAIIDMKIKAVRVVLLVMSDR